MIYPLSDIGRRGQVRLEFKKKKDKTLLYRSFSTMPVRVLQPFYLDSTGCACVYLLNPTAGILGGDRIEVQITLGSNSHALLSTPSATKLLRGNEELSYQYTDVLVKEGAFLEYIPGYTVPFAGSRHEQNLRIQLCGGSKAIVVDSFVTGRVAMGEDLQFKEYRNTVEIVYDNRRVVTERYVLSPSEQDYRVLGVLEGYHATAGIFVFVDDPSKRQCLRESLWRVLENSRDVLGGISCLEDNGVVVRLLAPGSYELEQTVFDLWITIRKEIIPSFSTDALRRFVFGGSVF